MENPETASHDAEKAEARARLSKLEGDLSKYKAEHESSGNMNKWMHQGIIILSVTASALAAGLAPFFEPRWAVSLIAAVPALGIALSHQLHCVEAANFRFRRVQLADALLIRIRYEYLEEVGKKEIAALAKEFRTFEEKLTLKWEEVVSAGLTQEKHANENSDKPAAPA